MTLSIILTYHRPAKIFRYIKHELKKCHTRNTVLGYVCDMSCISATQPTAFAVTLFLGDITPFSKPGRCFGNYVASLGRSFTVVNALGSRPVFRVSSVVIRSVFMNVISIQT